MYQLSVSRGAALYIGAQLGPGLLLLPGLAAAKAGPASILAWFGLLLLSALLGTVFAALGIRFPSGTGVRGYADAGLGRWAGRATSWCFLAGIITGAPVICVIGAIYISELAGAGPGAASVIAVVLLVGVLALSRRGVRTSTSVQFGLVVLLLVVVVVGVAGAAPAARAENWTPFAPHGWTAIVAAASALMLSFAGWEAVAPLTGRFADPRRQLPKVVAITFVVISLIYLALAAVTIGALGTDAGTAVPLASLLVLAIGPAGFTVAAVCAAILTVGTINAYLSGASALARTLTANDREGDTPPAWLLGAILTAGSVIIGLLGIGIVPLDALVAIPSAMFLMVYLSCTAAACRLLSGGTKVAAAVAFVAVVVILVFTGPAAIPAVILTLVTAFARRPRVPQPASKQTSRC
ncbi:MAG: amino acid permease [Kibdelosporangium sp.]